MNNRILLCFIFLFYFLNLSAQSSKTYTLMIGLEFVNDSIYAAKYYKSFDSDATSGVSRDIDKMTSISNRNAHDVVKLINKDASIENIKNAFDFIGKQIKKNDTFIFYFSGHGDSLQDMNGDEKSGFDQALVAYNDFLIDDEIYILLRKYFTETKNIMIIDACHSSTSYKMAQFLLDFKINSKNKNKFLNESKVFNQELVSTGKCNFIHEPVEEPFSLIYFGATEDENTAFGDVNGGLLTYFMDYIINKALLAGNWKNYNYQKLACELSKMMNTKGQNLQYHEIGKEVNSYLNQIPFKTI